MIAKNEPPLIVHVLYRFATGGLENGVVNLINHLPKERFRHAVVAMTDATDFARRIRRDDVRIVELHKAPGNSLAIQHKFRNLFRGMRADVVHTRNLGALEAQMGAAWARVPVRIHGEHGWDMQDAGSTRRRYILMRRMLSPFVHRYVALSGQIEDYLRTRVHIPTDRIERICNGVDSERFRPSAARRSEFPFPSFRDPNLVLIGTVGRLEPIKDQLSLAKAFVTLLEREPAVRRFARLVIIGSGSLRPAIDKVLADRGAAELAWLPGQCADVAQLLCALDIFVLPSRAEGISNTILEAMASGLPVIATAVGGNAELVADERTGLLVAPNDPVALAGAMHRLTLDASLRARMGAAGRRDAEGRFSLHEMMRRYAELYETQLARRGLRTSAHAGHQQLQADRSTEARASCAE